MTLNENKRQCISTSREEYLKMKRNNTLFLLHGTCDKFCLSNSFKELKLKLSFMPKHGAQLNRGGEILAKEVGARHLENDVLPIAKTGDLFST